MEISDIRRQCSAMTGRSLRSGMKSSRHQNWHRFARPGGDLCNEGRCRPIIERAARFHVLGDVVVAHGRIYVGTDNGAGYLKRYSSKVDLGVLLCFRESDGEFLWQHSSNKLPRAKTNDSPFQGICSQSPSSKVIGFHGL